MKIFYKYILNLLRRIFILGKRNKRGNYYNLFSIFNITIQTTRHKMEYICRCPGGF